jgi:pyridoxamine 5'-phosphate oxidase
MDITQLREEYRRARLDEAEASKDPVAQFHRWFEEARAAEILEPNAMSLATAAADGAPSVRTVLLKVADARGFVFFTDYRSPKSRDLEANPRAALCFWWGPLQRQVRVTGRVGRVSAEESAAYFRTRPHESQLGAWASEQSSVLEGRGVLERRVEALEAVHAKGEVPTPPNWGGFRLVPESYEFWQGRPGRLHDRLRFRRANDAWVIERLSP